MLIVSECIPLVAGGFVSPRGRRAERGGAGGPGGARRARRAGLGGAGGPGGARRARRAAGRAGRLAQPPLAEAGQDGDPHAAVLAALRDTSQAGGRGGTQSDARRALG